MASGNDSRTKAVLARILKKQGLGGTHDIHILELSYSKVDGNGDSDKKRAFRSCKQLLAKEVLLHDAAHHNLVGLVKRSTRPSIKCCTYVVTFFMLEI